MANKRVIKAKDIMTDLRGGLTNSGLMEKYQLSAKGLASIFNKLIRAEAVRIGELDHRMPNAADTVALEESRCYARKYLAFRLLVHGATNPSPEGRIRDITERGLQIVGIPASAGDKKTFLIEPTDFVDLIPFKFEAECRWSKLEVEREQTIAGFQITEISDDSLERLRNLIQALTLGGE